MRHLLLILMIALLPLRGWAADGMTVSMGVRQLQASQAVSAVHGAAAKSQQPFAATQVAQMLDCDMVMAAADASKNDTADSVPSPLCKGCTACQLCMALVTGYPGVQTATLPRPQAKRLAGRVSFTSAVRAPGFKPPIS